MLIPWLEELEQNNSISKEAAQAIYKDCSDLIESAISEKTADSTIGLLTPAQEEFIMREDPEAFLAFKNNVAAISENAEDRKGQELYKRLDVEQARSGARAAELQRNAAKFDAVAAKIRMKDTALNFVNKGVTAMTGPMTDIIEKGTRPYRIAANAHMTGQFLGRSFEEKDLPKAFARYEEILDIAPSLAQDPLTMHKIVNSSLHSGLSSEDKNVLRQMQASERHSMWDMGRTKTTLLKAHEFKMKDSLQRALRKSEGYPSS